MSTDINLHTLKEMIREKEESEKLKAVRLGYLDLFKNLPFPGRDDENWKNTDLKDYLKLETALAQSYNFSDSSSGLSGTDTGVDVQGSLEGCCIYSMGEAAELGYLNGLKGIEKLVQYSPDAMVRALFTMGVYVKALKRKNRMEGKTKTCGDKKRTTENILKINIENLKKSAGEDYIFYWIVVDVESEVNIVLVDNTQNSGRIFGEIDILAGSGSKIQYVSIDDTFSGGFHRKKTVISAGKNSNIDTHTAVTGAGDFRGELELIVQASGVRAELNKAYIGEGKARKDFVTLQHHASGEAYSSLSVLGALGGASSGSFTGTIVVDRRAQKTDAYQLSKTLLLSDLSRARAVPRLEILADDVKCSHGASLGRVDKDDMFYLMSRGISKNDAEIMAAEGFFGRFIDALPDSGVEKLVSERINASLKRICS